MVFLFTKIDHPTLYGDRGTPTADHIISCQLFLLEEILFKHNTQWMKRTANGVLAILTEADAVQTALAIAENFQEHVWETYDKAKVSVVLHVGEAEAYGQEFVGPDFVHAQKVLEAAWGGQVLFTFPAVHFIPIPPGGRLLDLGPHFLKDLSEPQNIYELLHPNLMIISHPPLKSLKSYPQNFTAQTSAFYGREEEIQEIDNLLTASTTRLVTLVGPGGFGKTRLGFRAAAEMVDDFPDGVFVVPLSMLLSDQLLVGSIANAIRFFFYGVEDPKTQLLEYLNGKKMLLVLDNFEHIMEGVELVSEILKAAPGVKVLATSRESLKVKGERVFEVKGLRYPEVDLVYGLEAYSGVQLFLKNARRIRPDFKLDETNRIAMIHICRLLEGMPLGLELSATWVGSLPLEEIVSKIETSRDFLATSMPHLPPRHRSLRAVFEYSWILLNEPQKRVLKAISVFRGGFEAVAALQVAGATGDFLQYLENKSLVRRRTDDRFEIHDLLKFYAKEKLHDDPTEMERVLDAHCAYFAYFLKKRERNFVGPEEKKTFEEMGVEMGNIETGWKRAVEKCKETEMGEYLDGLFNIFQIKGWFTQGRELFRDAAAVLEAKYSGESRRSSKSLHLAARVVYSWAFFEKDLSDLKSARALFDKSLALYKAAGAMGQAGEALAGLGMVAEMEGHFEEARGIYSRSLAVLKRSKNRPAIIQAVNHLGHILTRLGEFKKAEVLIRQGLRAAEAVGDRGGMAYSYNLLGDNLHESGRYQQAREYYQKGLAGYVEKGERKGVAWSFLNLGKSAEVMGDFTGARQMYQECQAICRELANLRGVAWSIGRTGFICWQTGETREAAHLYEESLGIYRSIGDIRGEAWVLDLLGALALARRESQEAEKYHMEAYALLEKLGLQTSNKAWHFYHLGAVEVLRENLSTAQEMFLKSLKYFESLNDTMGLAAVYTQLGEVAANTREFEEAEDYLRKAVSISLEARLTPYLVDALVVLGRYYELKADEERAIHYLMASLANPACRQQTRDRVVTLAMKLRSFFSPEEVEGIKQWSHAVHIEDVATDWLVSARRPTSARKGRTPGSKKPPVRKQAKPQKAKPVASRKKRK